MAYQISFGCVSSRTAGMIAREREGQDERFHRCKWYNVALLPCPFISLCVFFLRLPVRLKLSLLRQALAV